MTAQATVLYDAPGPRARRRSNIISLLGAVALVALIGWLVYRLSIPQVAANGNETAPIELATISQPPVALVSCSVAVSNECVSRFDRARCNACEWLP